MDRFSGSLVVSGEVADVEAAVKAALNTLVNVLGFTETEITKS